MSDYGRGGYPDRPTDPWRREDPGPTRPGSPFGPEQYGAPEPDGPPGPYRPPDRYGPPDQYGPPERYGSPRQYSPAEPYAEAQRGYPQPGQPPANPYPPAAPWTPAAAPPAKKNSTGLIVTLVVVLVLVLCGGGALALYLIGSKDPTPTAQKPAGPTGPVASASAARPSAAASSGYDPTSIIKGQCVVNDGDENTPKLRVATCGAGTYLVLARFDGTDDTKKCDPVAGSTHNYYYQTTPSTLDFVLCLKKQ